MSKEIIVGVMPNPNNFLVGGERFYHASDPLEHVRGDNARSLRTCRAACLVERATVK